MATGNLLVAFLHDHYDADHLSEVVEEMKTLGAPTIRAAWNPSGCWAALEGCHRLRAAEILGLVPTIIPIDYDEETTTEDVGFTDDELPDVLEIASVVEKSIHRSMIEFSPEDN